MEEHWIESLRKRFADRQSAVPDNLWSAVSAAMNNEEMAAIDSNPKGRKGRRVILLAKRTAAVAACIAVIFGVWYFSRTDMGTITGVTGHETVDKNIFKGQNNVSGSDVYTPAPGTSLAVMRHVDVNDYMYYPNKEDGGVPVGQTDDEGVKTSDGDTVSTETFIEAEGADNRCESGANPAANRHNSLGASGDGSQLAFHPKKDNERKVSFGVYGSNFTSINGSSGGNNTFYTAGNMQADMIVFGDNSNNFKPLYDNNMRLNGSGEVNVRHRHPIKVGLSVRFGLTDRLALESGLSYSYLSSDISADNGYGRYTTEQKLHYVGVPLNLNVNLWRSKHFEAYVSGGGMAEFCVSGHSSTENMPGSPVSLKKEADIRETRPQWSVNALVGAQYNFNDRIGVYAEPGVSYYFDNGSDVMTIYKDKPFSLNLNVGLRFSVNKR